LKADEVLEKSLKLTITFSYLLVLFPKADVLCVWIWGYDREYVLRTSFCRLFIITVLFGTSLLCC